MINDTISMSEKHRSRTGRVVTLLVSLILLLTLATGMTLTYMFLDTEGVTNSFTAAEETDPTIYESFIESGVEKSNVRVNASVSDYAVYVRAKVVINWSNENGEVLAVTPPVENEDYIITYDQSGMWFYCDSDGFWYYKTPVNNVDTSALIELCRIQKPAPISGYTLQVDILTQTIQAAGVTADGKSPVEEAWGVAVDPDTKTISK